jgi:hypothetical protein
MGVKGGQRVRLVNRTAICDPIVQKMWEPRRLETLWACTAHYRDSFTFLHVQKVSKRIYCSSVITIISFECSSEVLCASVLVKSGLENRDYGRRGSAALTMRHPSIRKSWH